MSIVNEKFDKISIRLSAPSIELMNRAINSIASPDGLAWCSPIQLTEPDGQFFSFASLFLLKKEVEEVPSPVLFDDVPF